jgi:hypothetical protein
MSKKKNKRYADDDGRTIVNMDVPGTSWYQENDPAKLRADTSETSLKQSIYPKVEPTRKELRQITWSALLAGLSIAAVYAVVWILFTLFATQVWLR